MRFLFWASLIAVTFLVVFSAMGVKVLGSNSTTPILDSVLEVDMNEIFRDDESVKGYDQLLQIVQGNQKTIYYRGDPKHPIFVRPSNDAGKKMVVLSQDENYLPPEDTRTKIVLRQQELNPSVYTVHMAVVSDSNDILWDSVIIEQRKEDEDLIAEFRKSQAIGDHVGDIGPHCAWIGNMILCSGTTEESPVDRMDILPVFNDMPFEGPADANDGIEWFQDVDGKRSRTISGDSANLLGNSESKQPTLDESPLIETHPNNLRKREINYGASAQELVPNKTEELIVPETRQEGQVLAPNSDIAKVKATEVIPISTTMDTTTLIPAPVATIKSDASASPTTTRTRTTARLQQPRGRSPIIALTSHERELYENPPGRMPLAFNMEKLPQGRRDYYEMDFSRYPPLGEYGIKDYGHIFPDYSSVPRPPPQSQKFRNKPEPNPQWANLKPYRYSFYPSSHMSDPMPVNSMFNSKPDSSSVDPNQRLKHYNPKHFSTPEFAFEKERKPASLPLPIITTITTPSSAAPFPVPSYGKSKRRDVVKKYYSPRQYPTRYEDYPSSLPMLYDY